MARVITIQGTSYNLVETSDFPSLARLLKTSSSGKPLPQTSMPGYYVNQSSDTYVGLAIDLSLAQSVYGNGLRLYFYESGKYYSGYAEFNFDTTNAVLSRCCLLYDPTGIGATLNNSSHFRKGTGNRLEMKLPPYCGVCCLNGALELLQSSSSGFNDGTALTYIDNTALTNSVAIAVAANAGTNSDTSVLVGTLNNGKRTNALQKRNIAAGTNTSVGTNSNGDIVINAQTTGGTVAATNTIVVYPQKKSYSELLLFIMHHNREQLRF